MNPEDHARLRDYRDDQQALAHHIDMAYRELLHAHTYVQSSIKVPAVHKERLKTILELAQEIQRKDAE